MRTKLRRIKDITFVLFFLGMCLAVGRQSHVPGDYGADLRLIVETDRKILECGEALPLTLKAVNNGESTTWFEMGEPYIELTNSAGQRISAPMPEPNTPPPGHYFMERNGERVYTVPAYRVEGADNVSQTIPDALKYYHGHVSEGMYELRAKITLAFFKESDVFRRTDHPDELWVQPHGSLAQTRLVSAPIGIELRENKVGDLRSRLLGWPFLMIGALIVAGVFGIAFFLKRRAVNVDTRS